MWRYQSHNSFRDRFISTKLALQHTEYCLPSSCGRKTASGDRTNGIDNSVYPGQFLRVWRNSCTGVAQAESHRVQQGIFNAETTSPIGTVSSHDRRSHRNNVRLHRKDSRSSRRILCADAQVVVYSHFLQAHQGLWGISERKRTHYTHKCEPFQCFWLLLCSSVCQSVKIKGMFELA